MTFTHNNQSYELLILHLAGSKLYGNSTPQSDTDLRGIFLTSKETKLGILGSVQQLEGIDVYKSLKKAGLDLAETDDICIWELNRFVDLAAQNNPNVCDTLCFDYNNPKYTVYINEKGKEIVDNRKLFLSSKLKFTFSGYAISQLNKIKNRDKYLNKYPDVSRVLAFIKQQYGRSIDWDWTCNNFGGVVAEFVSEFKETAQNHTELSITVSWNDFKEWSGIEDIDRYRIPQLLSYCYAKDLKGNRISLEELQWNMERYYSEGQTEDCSLKEFLQTRASFRPFSPSMLAIYTEGTGIFTANGKLKSAEPEHIGDFVCLLSIDQMKYKADKDFNAAMWEWKCNRNEARSELEKLYGYDTKNASHLVRLMEQAKYIMNYGDYNPTLHGVTLQMVKDVRAGKFTYEEILEYGDSVDAELNELYKTTLLSKKADMVGINNLVLKLQGF